MEKLVSMLIMTGIGILSVRCGLLKTSDSRVLSALIVYILQPAIILNALNLTLTRSLLRAFLCGFLFSCLVYLLWILTAFLLKKPFRLSPVDMDSFIYSNVANLTMPVAAAVLGGEAVFFMTALQLPFHLFMWTHGYSLMSGQKGFSPGKFLKNPNIIAMGAGLLILFCRIPLPAVVSDTISLLSSAVAATSMILTGIVIADSNLRRIFLEKRAYLILFGRLIAFPLLAMGVLYLSGFLRRFPEFIPVFQAIFVGLCAPPAATVSQLAVLFDREPVQANIYNMLGMFLCIVTMPAMNFVFELIFMRG